ncbi:MAG: hypothetical protein ACXWXB_08190 [Actinomycetota bacterium]
MAKVAAGRFDGPLRRWFRDARDLGIPLWVEFGVEVNGRWFPWNGVWNGGGRTDGCGDAAKPDGPERFRHAYRHVVRLARDGGADDLTWVFHVDIQRWPDAADDPHSGTWTCDRSPRRSRSPLVEFGVTEDPKEGDKAEWYAEAYDAVTPPDGAHGFDLVSVWSERWNNGGGVISDLRVNSSPSAREAYRAGIADPALVSSPSFTCV